ncbi:MAG TPA: hypothetical protein VL334_02600 [Anaerolineae bacterium]|nr:hypothetical protein [Anaerolineae bacterium]
MATDNNSTRWEPLPEIIIPDDLIVERERGFNRLVYDPPDVDCIHVLGRSGPLAAAGLVEDTALVWALGLPPLLVVDGVGNEVYWEWIDAMQAQDSEWEAPDGDLGEFAEEEDRQAFTGWIAEDSSPAVRATIGRLRAIPAPCRRIAVLDDVYIHGNVTLGVAPVLYKAAYGDDQAYNPADNRFIFRSASWLRLIVETTFLSSAGPFNERQGKFLTELAKGQVDRVNFRLIDPNDIRSLDQLADFYANRSAIWDTRSPNPPESVYSLIDRYGANLFQFHARIRVALVEHTRKCFRNHG